VMDEKMKDEVKITVIATGFKETPKGREHAHEAASAALNRVTHTDRVPQVRAPHLGANLGNQSAQSPFVSSRGEVGARNLQSEVPPSETRNVKPEAHVVEPRNSQPETTYVGSGYIPDSVDDYELGSEVVRHAQEVEDMGGPQLPSSGNCGESSDEALPIDTVTSSVDIDYDANDLEIPAFMRKRGDS
jgi:hypothetical protein